MNETRKPVDEDDHDDCPGWPAFCYEACPPPPEMDLRSIVCRLREFLDTERDVTKIITCIKKFLELLENLPDGTKVLTVKQLRSDDKLK